MVVHLILHQHFFHPNIIVWWLIHPMKMNPEHGKSAKIPENTLVTSRAPWWKNDCCGWWRVVRPPWEPAACAAGHALQSPGSKALEKNMEKKNHKDLPSEKAILGKIWENPPVAMDTLGFKCGNGKLLIVNCTPCNREHPTMFLSYGHIGPNCPIQIPQRVGTD